MEDDGTAIVQNTSTKKHGISLGVNKEKEGEDKVVYEGTGSVQVAGTANITVGADEKEEEANMGQLQEVVGGEKIYTGEKNYAKFFKEGESKIKGGGLKAGPVKATGFVRQSIVIDYNPSVCKDYKQTGYCGYGQNCKYVHDRGDYKSGWEIDKEWEAKQRGEEEEDYEIHSDEDDEELPFACFICRNEFVDPVVTKCGHYFCENCALKQERKKKRCFICNEPTGGIFNQPHALIAKLKEKKDKEQREREQE